MFFRRPLSRPTSSDRGGSRKQEKDVAKAFLKYLEEEGKKKSMPAEQLKEIYEGDFCDEYETHGVRFQRGVLNALCYHLNECQYVQGKVVFGRGEEAVLQMLECDSDSDPDEELCHGHYCEVCKRDLKSREGHQLHLNTVQHRQQHILRTIRKTLERPELIQDKNGVVVTSVPRSDENGVIELKLESGTSGNVTLIIQNHGLETVQLNHITLLWSVQFFDYSDISTIDCDRGLLPRGSSRQFNVGCKRRREFGYSYVPAVFSFEKAGEDFYIMKFLSVRIVSDIYDDLKATSVYRRSRRPDPIPYDVITIPGMSLPRLSTNKLTFGKFLPKYDIPPTVKALVPRSDTVTGIIRY